MPVRPEDYDEIVSKINKKYANSIRQGSSYETAPRISTGSLELDLAMGGGIPVGRWTRLYGGYHSAKTLTALNVIREAQDMGLTCAYYNVEKQYDAQFSAQRLGINTDELTLVEGTTVEEIGEKMESLMTVCHVHVIDSCSIAVSEDELDADIRDWRPGLTARAWGKVFRRINERFDFLANTVILIDQMSMNFKTSSEQPKGGKVFDHQSSMSVLFKKGSWLWRKDGLLSDDEKAPRGKGMDGQIVPSGYEIKCRVEKSRVCRPFRTATMWLDLDQLSLKADGEIFDRIREFQKSATHYGVIRQAGSYYYYTPPGKEEITIGQGKPALRNFIRSDLTLQEEIRETAMRLVDS